MAYKLEEFGEENGIKRYFGLHCLGNKRGGVTTDPKDLKRIVRKCY